MAAFHGFFARIGSRRFHRRLRRKCVQFLRQLHDRTAVLRDMHRVEWRVALAEMHPIRGGQLEKGTARRTELVVAGMSDLPQ